MIAAKEFLESIKFSHSIFALPFALMATLLARQGTLPQLREVAFVIICMVGARTWAMGVNRLVDSRIDAANPRTQNRAVPSGRISPQRMILFSGIGAMVFSLSAYALSPLAGWLSLPVLIILASYSFTKRFTFFCHFWLGICLGLAPLGAWVALKNTFPIEMIWLSMGIALWVAGFDILYALQDEAFDKKVKLHSIPARFGTSVSVVVSRISHFFAAICFAVFGHLYQLGTLFFTGLFVACVLMLWQHWLTRKGNLDRIGIAFFNLNGWIAVLLFSCAAASLYIK
jgi:4-hydroxybenzoate polyprenyltransferase